MAEWSTRERAWGGRLDPGWQITAGTGTVAGGVLALNGTIETLAEYTIDTPGSGSIVCLSGADTTAWTVSWIGPAVEYHLRHTPGATFTLTGQRRDYDGTTWQDSGTIPLRTYPVLPTVTAAVTAFANIATPGWSPPPPARGLNMWQTMSGLAHQQYLSSYVNDSKAHNPVSTACRMRIATSGPLTVTYAGGLAARANLATLTDPFDIVDPGRWISSMLPFTTASELHTGLAGGVTGAAWSYAWRDGDALTLELGTQDPGVQLLITSNACETGFGGGTGVMVSRIDILTGVDWQGSIQWYGGYYGLAYADIIGDPVPFDPAAMRWIRMRRAGLAMVAEYGPSAAGPWTPLGAVTCTEAAFAGVRVQINDLDDRDTTTDASCVRGLSVTGPSAGTGVVAATRVRMPDGRWITAGGGPGPAIMPDASGGVRPWRGSPVAVRREGGTWTPTAVGG